MHFMNKEAKGTAVSDGKYYKHILERSLVGKHQSYTIWDKLSPGIVSLLKGQLRQPLYWPPLKGWGCGETDISPGGFCCRLTWLPLRLCNSFLVSVLDNHSTLFKHGSWLQRMPVTGTIRWKGSKCLCAGHTTSIETITSIISFAQREMFLPKLARNHFRHVWDWNKTYG